MLFPHPPHDPVPCYSPLFHGTDLLSPHFFMAQALCHPYPQWYILSGTSFTSISQIPCRPSPRWCSPFHSSFPWFSHFSSPWYCKLLALNFMILSPWYCPCAPSPPTSLSSMVLSHIAPLLHGAVPLSLLFPSWFCPHHPLMLHDTGAL